MRAAAAAQLPLLGRPGHDYVLVARASVLSCEFDALKNDMAKAIGSAHENWTTGRREREHMTMTRPVAVTLLSAPIHFYRRFLSPLKPPSCRFQPTCSSYALEALQEHGAARGLALAIKRGWRCHPISWLGGASGFDPVPHRRSPTHE